MKTKRLGLVSAATLVLAMVSMPVLAQDAPRKKERSSRVPRTRVPQKPTSAPKQASEDDSEGTPTAEADTAQEPAETNDAADETTPSEPASGGASDDALDQALDPEDATAPADDDEEAAPKPPATRGPAADRGGRPPKRRGRRGVPAPSATSKAKPHELEYVEGMDIPSDYTLVERSRTGLVVAGAVTFGVGWLAAATFAASQSGRDGECDTFGSSRDGDDESFGAWSCEHGGDHADFAPLYIPLAGPFIALATLEDAYGPLRAGLLLDGVVQVGGAAMFVAGLVAKKSTLIRTKFATMSVVPGPGSVQLFGSF